MSTGVFDEEGFLIESSLWNEELCRIMAEKQFNISLNGQQLKIVNYVRNYYKKWETLPIIKTIKDEFGITTEELDEQFKKGGSTARGVICKLAGLPKMLCIASGC